MRPSRMRHRIQATVAILGTVSAVYGVSRLVKPKPAAEAVVVPIPTQAPLVPIIPRVDPPVAQGVVTPPPPQTDRDSDDAEPSLADAVAENDIDAVKRALRRGDKVDAEILGSATASTLDVLLTAKIERAEIAKAIDAAGGEEGAALVKKLAATKGIAWSWRDDSGDEHAPLIDAVDRQDHAVVRAMIEVGAPVNQTTEHGRSALGVAVAATSPGSDDAMRIVRSLLARGADPNRRLDTGERLLAKAAAAGDLRVVTMLLDHGARINDGLAAADDETALEAAENAGNADIARMLRARGARRRPIPIDD